MKKLKVKTLLQEKNSSDCGPVSVQIILNYFNIQKSTDELAEGMLRDDTTGGTYIYENGLQMLLQDLSVELITGNPIIFERESWSDLKSEKNLKKHLKKFVSNNPKKKNPIEQLTKFIENGGKIKIEIPTFEHICKAVDNNKLVLASIYGRALGSKEGGYHYVVVSGYKKDSVYINNPLPGSKTGWFSSKDFMHAVLSSSCFDIDNGALLIVGKSN